MSLRPKGLPEIPAQTMAVARAAFPHGTPPMSVDVVRFWAGFGIVIMDAWGLTETTGVATSNSPKAGFRLGSVGRPVESAEIRLAEDGEILVRGSSVFSGYLQPDGSVRYGPDAADDEDQARAFARRYLAPLLDA